jgi:hypothetical protein
MPWSVADVDKFKKGLSDSEKKKWVNVANSVLEKCLKNGGKQDECEASAIRQANGSVGNNESMEKLSSINNNYQKRYAQHQGKRHLVVPVVMMVEGVHVGSHGALLHPIEELGRVPEAYNGMPIVVQHPTDENGRDVSANIPDILDRELVGRVYNTHVDGEKLIAEAWIDEERLREKSQKALQYVEDRKPLDVSIGVFTDEEVKEGQWNGENYVRVAHNHRPDHLAILPDAQGACSWEDGCGLNRNEERKEEGKMKTKQLTLTFQLEDDELSVNVENPKKEGGQKMTKKEKVDKIIANKANQFTKDDADFLNGLEDNQLDKFVTEEKQEKPCCPDKVEELINNSSFTEDDREWLLKQSQEDIDRLSKATASKKEEGPSTNSKGEEEDKKDDKKEPTKIDGKMLANALKEHIKKPEDFLGLMPDEVKDMYESGLKLHREKRDGMIEGIMNHTSKFEKEELQKMDNGLLEKIYESVTPKSDYSLFGVPSVNEDKGGEDDKKDKQEILYPIEVLQAQKDKESKKE